jgi:hypothetical protein
MSPRTGHEPPQIVERDERLTEFSDSDLRRELRAREQEQTLAHFDALGPCPECGGKILAQETEIVETFRSAPKWKGWPAPPLPEYVQEDGHRWEIRLTCENGHVTVKEEIKFRG